MSRPNSARDRPRTSAPARRPRSRPGFDVSHQVTGQRLDVLSKPEGFSVDPLLDSLLAVELIEGHFPDLRANAQPVADRPQALDREGRRAVSPENRAHLRFHPLEGSGRLQLAPESRLVEMDPRRLTVHVRGTVRGKRLQREIPVP